MLKNIFKIIISLSMSLFIVQCATTETKSAKNPTVSGEYQFTVLKDSVTLQWVPPAIDSVDSYEVFYRGKSESAWHQISTAKITATTQPKVTISRNQVATEESAFYFGVVSVFKNGKKSILHTCIDSSMSINKWLLYWPVKQ